MKKHSALLFNSVASCAVLIATPALAQDASGTQLGATADIIVTAQRRAERAQDVPIAITAFSPERLQQQNITQSQDLNASVPSLVVGSAGQGSRDSQTFTLRGQGATFQASPGVVLYLNEVPLPAPITLSQQGGPGNFVDLENLQVLAGPQGTLFGRNTTGGAILLVPHKPTNDFSGSLLAKYGNYEAKEIEGVINVPVVEDKLLVRVVGAYHDRDGYTHDVIWNKDRDDTHWYSGRIGITFRPTERIENYLMAYGSYSRFNGTGLIHKGFNIDGTAGLAQLQLCSNTPIATSGPFSCDVYRATTAQADALGPRQTAHGIDDYQKTKTWGITDTLSFDLNDELVLRNIVSYQKFKSFYRYDGDGTVLQQYDVDPYKLPAPGQVTLPGVGTPVVYNNTSPVTLPRDSYKQFTEEFQIQGTYLDNKLTFTAGGFYYSQKPDGDQAGSAINYCPAGLTGTPLPGIPPACVANATPGYVATTSKALYAQGTFDFGAMTPSLDSLRLTGGFRYTWDKIKGFSQSYTPTLTGQFICSADSSLVDAISDCNFTASLKSKAATWLVGLDYKPVRDLMVFAKVSRGYKAGGFNPYAVRETTRTFEPEKVTSYEAGFKSDFRIASVPARLNASYYYLNYQNIQKATGDFNPVTLASGARINAAKAHVSGVEVDASIRPWKPIEIGGNFSYTRFKYTEYTLPSNGFLADCSGTALPPGTPTDLTCLPGQYVVPYIYSFHVAVNLPIAERLGDLSFFVNYAHNSSQHTEATVVAPQQPGEKLDAFGLLNMSLDWNNIAGSGLDAGLYVTNATNKLYRISNTDVYQGGSLLSWATIYGEPRMYGLKLRYRFGGE